MRIHQSGVMFVMMYVIDISPYRESKYGCTYIFITGQFLYVIVNKDPKQRLRVSHMPNSSAFLATIRFLSIGSLVPSSEPYLVSLSMCLIKPTVVETIFPYNVSKTL